MGFVSRWPVLTRHPVAAGDVDETGQVRGEAVERWAAAACAEYLRQCPGIRVRHVRGQAPAPAPLGRPESVVVSARATEVRPDSFTLSVRLRPIGDDAGRVLDVTRVVELDDDRVGRELRDHLIAIEHAASHIN